jgi:2-phosphoglycerate kinase
MEKGSAFLPIMIGGSSSVGKTTAARVLADRRGWDLVQTDHALPEDPTLQPLAGPDEILDRPAVELCALLIAAANAAIPVVRSLIAECPGTAGLIVEGERIHPQLIAELEREGRASGVLVVETDAERLYDTLISRSPGFRRLAESRRRCVAEMDRLYGQWLLEQGSRLGVPCISSQPWTSLPDRILECGSR